MIILSIDTSADETSAAVVEENKILSNIIWSQASLHAKWGGIFPSLAKRLHQERIDWVVEKAVKSSKLKIESLDAVAVTIGPGLAPALEVGIHYAKQFALANKIPLIPVNHLEGHIVSALAQPNSPNSLALIVSGGHTELVLVKQIGQYQVLAQTLDDALGEALDKASMMLGLGYPGGAVLEKLAKEGNPLAYKLTLPLLGRENQGKFSYSGLKTAFYRLTHQKSFTKQEICDLAASFQNIAFAHLIRIISRTISDYKSYKNYNFYHLLVGGGVAANVELRRRLRKLGRESGFKVHFPYTKKLCTDNAAMIGLAAQFAFNRGESAKTEAEINAIDRQPDLDFLS